MCGPRTCPGKPDTQRQHKPLRQSNQQNLELHEIGTAPSLTFFYKKKIWFIFESDVCHLLILPRSTNLIHEIFYCIFLQRGQNAPHLSGTMASTYDIFPVSSLSLSPNWHPKPQLTWRDAGTDFPFFLAMCLIIFMAFAFLFWDISHLGDSGMHLGCKGRAGVLGGILLREFQSDLPRTCQGYCGSTWGSVLP